MAAIAPTVADAIESAGGWLFDQALAGWDVTVITAEQARAYKPSRRLFDYAYDKMGVTKDETVHVAMGMIHDMQACHELGVRAIWINRRGEKGNPDWNVVMPLTSHPPRILCSRPTAS